MDPLDELKVLALGMGFAEEQIQRCLATLADTAEAQSLFLQQPERLVSALLEFGPQQKPAQARPAAGGAAGGGGSGGSGDAIDLCSSEDDDEPAPAAKRARADAPPPVPAEPVARAAPPPPAAAAASAGAGAGGSLMAQLAAERHARRGVPVALPAEVEPPALEEVKLLTYNVWFREDLEVEKRMAGIAAIVAAERPHVLCLQEVTPNIEALLRRSPFWADFDASPAPGGAPYYSLLLLRRLNPGPQRVAFQRGAFQNSTQGRDLTRGGLALGGGLRLIAATAHLESYLGPGATSSRERVEQMRESLRALDADASSGSFGGTGNVLFAGDTNWDDAEDGDLGRLLPPGWLDSWRAVQPGQAGYTYDATANGMLMGSLRKRLDRVLVRLRDYEPAEARMVGTQPLPGVSYEKTFRNGGSKRLPVLPSDHFGLVFTMRRKKAPQA